MVQAFLARAKAAHSYRRDCLVRHCWPGVISGNSGRMVGAKLRWALMPQLYAGSGRADVCCGYILRLRLLGQHEAFPQGKRLTSRSPDTTAYLLRTRPFAAGQLCDRQGGLSLSLSKGEG